MRRVERLREQMAETLTEHARDINSLGGTSPVVDDGERSVDLGEVYRTLRGGLRVILAITAVLTVLAILASFLVPVRYTSSTSFIPPSVGGGSLAAGALAGQLAPFGGSDLLGIGKNSADL